jgi:cyclopropane-fatty-acyl-phospholipid synthase
MLGIPRDAGHSGELTGLTLSQEQLTYDRLQLGLNVSLSSFIIEPFNGRSMIASIPSVP